MGRLTNICRGGDGEATPQSHVSGEVRSVGGTGAQDVPDADRVDQLRLQTDTLHGTIGGQHLEVNRAVAFQRPSECTKWSSLGGHHKDSSGQDVTHGHD